MKRTPGKHTVIALKTPQGELKINMNTTENYEFIVRSKGSNTTLNVQKIKQLINEKKVIYDHNVDQRQYKWSGKVKLKKIDTTLLPEYIQSNLEKHKDWLD